MDMLLKVHKDNDNYVCNNTSLDNSIYIWNLFIPLYLFTCISLFKSNNLCFKSNHVYGIEKRIKKRIKGWFSSFEGWRKSKDIFSNISKKEYQ